MMNGILTVVKVAVIMSALVIVAGNSQAQTGSAPVVGGSILAVNVDVVATTGYRASKLLGSDIYNDQGEKIGKLDDFIVSSNVDVSVAIVGVGGFLGMGSRMVAVPANLFESNNKGQTVLPGATKDELKALPEYRYAK
jgi:sporulation protein YlmC with PRC-barrel domain